MIGATDKLAEFIKSPENTTAARLESIADRARFANSAIDRIVPKQPEGAGLNIEIETFFEWVVEQKPFAPHAHPDVPAIHWVDELAPYIERKLFTVNTGHAVAAYYGHAAKKTYVHEAMADPAIKAKVHDVLAETSHLIVNKHGVTVDEQKAYVEKIIKRISNPALNDGVDRVGRAPLRKLGREERFVNPGHSLAEQGDKYDAILGAMEQGFHFVNVEGDEESVELAKILKEDSAEDVVKKVCGLDPKDKMFAKVLEVVKKVQK